MTAGRPAAKANSKLVRALKRAGINQSVLAEKLRVTRQAVSYWCRTGVPAERTHLVARVLGCTVRELRPDVYRDIDDRR